jgi:WD40 repeat protein
VKKCIICGEEYSAGTLKCKCDWDYTQDILNFPSLTKFSTQQLNEELQKIETAKQLYEEKTRPNISFAVEERERYCSHCGRELTATLPVADAPRRTRGPRVMMVILALVLLVGGVVAYVLTLSGTSKTRPISPADIGEVEPLNQIGSFILEVAFSPDGRLMAAASMDCLLHLYDTGSLKEVRFIDTGGIVCNIAFSPDSTLLASFSRPLTKFFGNVDIWRVADGSLVHTLNGYINFSSYVAFSPDGTLLAVSYDDCTVRLWNVADWSLARTLEVEDIDIEDMCEVAFSPDGALLAACSESASSGMVHLWRVADGSLVRTLEGYINCVAFSPDGALLATGSHNTVQLWNVADWSLVRTLEVEDIGPGFITVAFSPDGSLLDASSMYHIVYLWRVADGSIVSTLDVSEDGTILPSVDFSPDGVLATVSDIVRLWKATP